jgi:hypothetical protein
MHSRRRLGNGCAIRCLWQTPDAARGYSSGVSLHSHTIHSREGLDFVPRVMRLAPPAQAALEMLEARHRRETGGGIPFERVFWRPPLVPLAAYRLEAAQIRDRLQLAPLVSITDHDSVQACAELRAIGIEAPYSLEWTVPYQATVFHIGVHNLPPERARELEAAMAEATAAPAAARIAELLAAVHRMPDALTVLNHPFCCEERVPRAVQVQLLLQFLDRFGGWVHALELNGLQCPADNLDTTRLGAMRGLPVISGGDRHCLEPNANVNLTHARSFAGFVHETRVEKRSSVLFLPQYRDAIAARYLEFIWQAVRNYPEFMGRERWVDRVFYTTDGGETVTMGSLWPDGGPVLLRAFVSLLGFLASPGMRAMLCMAMGRTVAREPEAL